MADPERPLTGEEEAAGSEAPVEQSQAILEESEERLADRNAAPSSFVEHRSSEEATAPPE